MSVATDLNLATSVERIAGIRVDYSEVRQEVLPSMMFKFSPDDCALELQLPIGPGSVFKDFKNFFNLKTSPVLGVPYGLPTNAVELFKQTFNETQIDAFQAELDSIKGQSLAQLVAAGYSCPQVEAAVTERLVESPFNQIVEAEVARRRGAKDLPGDAIAQKMAWPAAPAAAAGTPVKGIGNVPNNIRTLT